MAFPRPHGTPFLVVAVPLPAARVDLVNKPVFQVLPCSQERNVRRCEPALLLCSAFSHPLLKSGYVEIVGYFESLLDSRVSR